jgi:hypothetical protein
MKKNFIIGHMHEKAYIVFVYLKFFQDSREKSGVFNIRLLSYNVSLQPDIM